MSNNFIQLTNLKKEYVMGENTVHALRGVDLHIDRGEFVAVMGASGSGKSTLMNILGCLDVPSDGTYLFEGEEIQRLKRQPSGCFTQQENGLRLPVLQSSCQDHGP